MTIKPRDKMPRKIEIDLTGPQGNAYSLLGTAKSLCKTCDKDFKEISKQMMSGDYENLLKVFNREFGDYVNLYW